jgi:methyltransferase (TIGR00027 family)
MTEISIEPFTQVHLDGLIALVAAEGWTIAPRTLFYDHVVAEAIGDGIRQTVMLAAGIETRAFRLPLAADVIVFALDLPEVLEQKQGILEQEHAEPRYSECRRRGGRFGTARVLVGRR